MHQTSAAPQLRRPGRVFRANSIAYSDINAWSAWMWEGAAGAIPRQFGCGCVAGDLSPGASFANIGGAVVCPSIVQLVLYNWYIDIIVRVGSVHLSTHWVDDIKDMDAAFEDMIAMDSSAAIACMLLTIIFGDMERLVECISRIC